MILGISIIGGTLGILGLGVAFVCLRRLSATQTTRKALQSEVILLSECLRARVEGIGADSSKALVSYFSALKAEMAEQIEQLENAQTKSATPYFAATEEVQYTRLVDRKDRFIGYRDALLNANVQIEIIIQNLKNDHVFIEEILERLSSRRWDSAMGNLELETIERVIKDLKREAMDDLIGGLRMKRAKAEIEHVMRFREVMIAVQKRLREEDVPNPKIAKVARSMNEN
jgi:hypothetical protein